MGYKREALSILDEYEREGVVDSTDKRLLKRSLIFVLDEIRG